MQTFGNLEFEEGTLTKNWWLGFLRRHGHLLVTKKGERFSCSRAEWTTYPNMKQMYDVVYDEFVDAGIAEQLEEPIWTDKEGNVVDESDAYGCIQDIKITKEHMLAFADEIGFNTNQKTDRQMAGEKKVVAAGTVPQSICSTTDHRFTMLPTTSALAEAVCCVLIFQTETGEVPLQWQPGHDKTIPLIQDANGKVVFEVNMGEGKRIRSGRYASSMAKSYLVLCMRRRAAG